MYSGGMLDHVSITVSDLNRSRAFWDATMAALGFPCLVARETQRGYGQRNRPEDDGHTYISIYESPARQVSADGRHWCFRAPDRRAVDAFHAAGLAHGGRSDGAPGLRDYHRAYYAAFLLDPDGNRIEAVCHRDP